MERQQRRYLEENLSICTDVLRLSRTFFSKSRTHIARFRVTLGGSTKHEVRGFLYRTFASFSGGYDECTTLAAALYIRGGYACSRCGSEPGGKCQSHTGSCVTDFGAARGPVARSAS